MATTNAGRQDVTIALVHCALVLCALLVLPRFAWPQSPPSPDSTAREAQDGQENLDSQLLEGLGDESTGSAGATPNSALSAEKSPPPAAGQDRVLDPFAEGTDVGPQNPLARIGRQMLRVEQLLVQRNVSVETQQTQRQIVDQLDELIDALAASQQAQKKRKPGAPQGDQQTKKPGQEAARNASGQTDESGAAGGQRITVVQDAVGEFWGHLPERFRRQMRSAEAIEFLPKYRKLIEDYYKRLAEDRGI